jgi:hypothetical protein
MWRIVGARPASPPTRNTDYAPDSRLAPRGRRRRRPYSLHMRFTCRRVQATRIPFATAGGGRLRLGVLPIDRIGNGDGFVVMAIAAPLVAASAGTSRTAGSSSRCRIGHWSLSPRSCRRLLRGASGDGGGARGRDSVASAAMTCAPRPIAVRNAARRCKRVWQDSGHIALIPLAADCFINLRLNGHGYAPSCVANPCHVTGPSLRRRLATSCAHLGGS